MVSQYLYIQAVKTLNYDIHTENCTNQSVQNFGKENLLVQMHPKSGVRGESKFNWPVSMIFHNSIGMQT